MSKRTVNQKAIIPLYNAELKEVLKIIVGKDEFADKLTAHILPKPVQVHPKRQPMNDIHNRPVQVTMPIPATKIYLLPWDHNDRSLKEEIGQHLPLSQLPIDFDAFDNLGPFAFRPGSGGGGGFRTITTPKTKLFATGILLVELDQVYPAAIVKSFEATTNPYELNLTDSFLDSLRVYTGKEPHQYKGFYITDNQQVNMIAKWPLMEIQGPPMKLNVEDLDELKKLFLQIWHIRVGSLKSVGLRIINLSVEYYYLSSTLTETRTIFIYLMIAFEALFKFPQERSASAASSRMAKLIAGTKADYTKIHKFMWDTEDKPGCCQLRNQIVHGNIASLSTRTFWQLKSLLRTAIMKLVYLAVSSKIDKEDYYNSLDSYVDKRFRKLPNK